MNRFNTQPPEGGWRQVRFQDMRRLSFNTQPPEGGWVCLDVDGRQPGGFNTQPPEGGWLILFSTSFFLNQFQHTAA